MEWHTRKLLTVVTEAVLERELLAELEALGASGYTLTEARGRGARGVRSSAWALGRNIRIEVICDAALADRIAAHLVERYRDRYALVLFAQDVSVTRSGKF